MSPRTRGDAWGGSTYAVGHAAAPLRCLWCARRLCRRLERRVASEALERLPDRFRLAVERSRDDSAARCAGPVAARRPRTSLADPASPMVDEVVLGLLSELRTGLAMAR